MSTHTDTNDDIDYELSPTAADDEATHNDPLDALVAHLDGLAGVTVDEADAHCCGALGCTRTDSRLWRIDVGGGRCRTLCPTHAVDFTRKERVTMSKQERGRPTHASPVDGASGPVVRGGRHE